MHEQYRESELDWQIGSNTVLLPRYNLPIWFFPFYRFRDKSTQWVQH